MAKKPGDSKIGAIKSTVVKATETAQEIAGADAISGIDEVTGVHATTAVGGTKSVGGVGGKRSTHTITLADREQIFAMVNEEAEKMFGKSKSSEARKRTVTEAVKMAIDAGLIGEETNSKDGGGKKSKK